MQSNLIKLIKNDAENDIALARIYELMQMEIEPNTLLGDELEVLSLLVSDYEKQHFAISKPHPIEAILFRLDQMGLSESDLSAILGSRSRKSEILSGQRKLSLEMIRRLNISLKIPAAVLISAY
jgi:HTH-type transcriptional regulator / antitoxin HigA